MKTEAPSSLSREFKLIGENGEEAGTLIMDPQSRIILRDTEGKVSGKFMPEASTQTQSNEIKPEKQPEEAKSEDLEKQPEEAKSEDLEKQPESESVEVKTD